MKTLALVLTLAAGRLLAQKINPGKEMFPPDIAPPNFTHRDILDVDRIHYRKDLDNDEFRVLHLTLKADESIPAHEADDGLFVCFRECHLRITDPQGHVQDIHLINGQTRWIGAGTRTEKNLSTQALEMLFIESKRAR